MSAIDVIEAVRKVSAKEKGSKRSVVCERFDDLGKDGRPCRLGIMGGTFDPIHNGHLACAEQAREDLGLDVIVFIPTANPVFKRDQRIAPANERLAMCRAAIADNPYFDVSDIEIARGGDTYTIDTLRALRAHYPKNVELFFLTGADAIATVSKWRGAQEMGNLAHFVGVDRPGFELTEQNRRQIVEDAKGITISFVTIEALEISSSELRRRLAQGKSIRYLTPQVVVDHVMEHEFYREGESHG